MIRWATEQQAFDPDHTVLHLGALLATFPFVGVVAGIVGRQLHLEGFVDQRSVRDQARRVLGDRSTIDVGARKVVTTLRYLSLLEGPLGGPLEMGRQPVVPPELSGWITHALLLTRGADAISVGEPSRAHEMATLKVAPDVWGQYPLLELHREPSRTVAVLA